MYEDDDDDASDGNNNHALILLRGQTMLIELSEKMLLRWKKANLQVFHSEGNRFRDARLGRVGV